MAEEETTNALLFAFFAVLLGVLAQLCLNRLPSWITIPYTVVIFLVGLLWGFLSRQGLGRMGDGVEEVSRIDPHLLLNVFLPVLIFESSYSLKWHVFRRLLPQMLLLAGPGVLISAALTACVLRGIESFSWAQALLLGSIISATDPVAVVALLKSVGGSVKLRTLIEGESLLNDGVAIVLFTVLLEIVEGTSAKAGHITETLFRLALGGLALGLAWSLVTIFLVGRVHKNLVIEASLTLCSSFLLFYTAETICKVSGVIAIVTLGVSFIFYGKSKISAAVQHSLHDFWATLAYLAETIIFVLAGCLVAFRVGFGNISGREYGMLFVLYIAVTVIRMIMLAMLVPVMHRLGYGFGKRRATVLVHAGLRGAVSLSLALVVDLSDDVPQNPRNKILFYTSGITFLTLCINATTMRPLIQALGLSEKTSVEQTYFAAGLGLLEKETQQSLKSMQLQKYFLCNWEVVGRFISLNKLISDAMPGGISPGADHQQSGHPAALLAATINNPLFEGGNGMDLNEPLLHESGGARGSSLYALNSVKSAHPAGASGGYEDEHEQEQALTLRIFVSRLLPAMGSEGEGPHPAVRTRGTPSSSTHELNMLEARLRFLEGLKASVDRQYLSGRLPGESRNVLINAIEASSDRGANALRMWDKFLGPVCARSRLLTWLRRTTFGSRWPVSALIENMLYWSTDKALSTADAYLEACKTVLRTFAAVDLEIVEQVQRECLEDALKAKQFVLKTDRKYTSITTQVRSKQVAHLVLSRQFEIVEELRLRGVFVATEVATIEAHLTAKQKQLVKHDIAFPEVSDAQLLCYHPLFTECGPDVLNRVLQQWEPRVFQSGDAVTQAGAASPGLLIILQGHVGFEQDTGHRPPQGASRERPTFEQLIGVGSVIGALETLTDTPSLITMTARSNLRCAFLDKFDVLQLAESSAAVRSTLQETAAYHFLSVMAPAVTPEIVPDAGHRRKLQIANVSGQNMLRVLAKGATWHVVAVGGKCTVGGLGGLVKGSVVREEEGEGEERGGRGASAAPALLPGGAVVAVRSGDGVEAVDRAEKDAAAAIVIDFHSASAVVEHRAHGSSHA